LLRSNLPDLYVSGWYILGGLLFTLLAYPVGNFVPELLPGARGATFSGLWIHDAIGLFVTPLALAMTFIVVPAITRRPIYSHFLSLLGFWLLFLVYPLNGTHHYVFSSIPMEAQRGAIVASVYLGVDVVLVVTNLLLSLRGSGGSVAANPALRFTWLSIICYLVVSLQGSLQALMPVNRFVHFTDWVIGHSHLAMIGFASFAAIGGMLYVWERIPGLRYNARAADWSFWLLASGLAVMVVDLTAAGMIQGQLWQSEAAWLESVRASQVPWLVRTLSGVLVLFGFVALFAAMTSGPRAEQATTVSASEGATNTEEQQGAEAVPGLAWLRSAYVLTAVAGVGFFVLSFVVLALWPNQVLDAQIRESKPSFLPELSAAEQRGRLVYIREGCTNCHSQLIRSTADDVRRFGSASRAWESERDYPQMWGTRRIGLDLARQHGRRSRDWQLAHLWNPRHVVPDSIMPAFPWLFAGSAVQPEQDALDLVAYLEWLGRDAELAGLTGPQPLGGMDPGEEKRRGMFCDCAIPRTAGGAPLFSAPQEPSERARFERRGAAVFARECSGCHGQQGHGDGPAASSLLPRPRDLGSARFSDRALSRMLWTGVRGSSMPGWSDLAMGDLRGLSAFIQSLEGDKREAGDAGDLSEEEQKRAVALYRSNCLTCHGENGSGNPYSTGTLVPAATNFREVRPSLRHAEAVLKEGIPGTAMQPWKDKLSDGESRLLGRYVRAFYEPE
jgi:cbb3-type cytochrome oxidase cytochrome c subunit/cytochrome c553